MTGFDLRFKEYSLNDAPTEAYVRDLLEDLKQAAAAQFKILKRIESSFAIVCLNGPAANGPSVCVIPLQLASPQEKQLIYKVVQTFSYNTKAVAVLNVAEADAGCRWVAGVRCAGICGSLVRTAEQERRQS